MVDDSFAYCNEFLGSTGSGEISLPSAPPFSS
jgi:hypothetical protein